MQGVIIWFVWHFGSHIVTLLVMSDFPECQTNQRVAACAACQCRILGLELKGLQSKTIDAYSRSIRYIGKYFGYEIRNLSEQQLTDYFVARIGTHSWSAVKLDLYGLKFFYRHVLKQPWQHVDLIKPPRTKRLPDIVTVEEAARLFNATQKLSYRVFFFTLYSMGLRLGEGLRLQVGDIDAARHRVHIRDAKGNKDRFVPLPDERQRGQPLNRGLLFVKPGTVYSLSSSEKNTMSLVSLISQSSKCAKQDQAPAY